YFERQEGVASVTVEGAKTREIQLELEEAALNQYGIMPNQLIDAINSSNSASSVGTIEGGDQDLQVRIKGEVESIDDIKETVVQTEDGARFEVQDFAKVTDTFKDTEAETLVNGSPSVVLSVMKKTDSNTVDVAQNVKGTLDSINADLPEGVELSVLIDTSEFIEEAVDSVIQNILLGGAISIRSEEHTSEL